MNAAPMCPDSKYRGGMNPAPALTRSVVTGKAIVKKVGTG